MSQAAWRGWRVRHWVAGARQLALARQQQELQQHAGQLDSELSCLSLDGLLDGGGSACMAACDAPEALHPELAAASCLPIGQQGAQPAAEPSAAAGSMRLHASLAAAQSLHDLPDQAGMASAGGRRQQLQGPADGCGCDDPATAAAYEWWRQQRQAAARKRGAAGSGSGGRCLAGTPTCGGSRSGGSQGSQGNGVVEGCICAATTGSVPPSPSGRAAGAAGQAAGNGIRMVRQPMQLHTLQFFG